MIAITGANGLLGNFILKKFIDEKASAIGLKRINSDLSFIDEDLRKIEMDPLHGYAKSIQHGVIGHGLNDYDAILSILKGAGFDGWISIEDGMNGMEELRQSSEFLRGKINQYFGT